MKKLLVAILDLSLVFAAVAVTGAFADDAGKDTTKKERGVQPMDKTKRTKHHHHRKKTTEGTATPDARKTTEQH